MNINIDLLIVAIAKDAVIQQIEQHFETELQPTPTTPDFVGEWNDEYIKGSTKLVYANGELTRHSIFKHNFELIHNNNPIGVLAWESYKYGCDRNCYLKIFNPNLYDGTYKQWHDAIAELGLTPLYISKLDIAVDSLINPIKRYERIAKDADTTIILNGRIVKDRSKLLASPFYIISTSLDCTKINKSLYFHTEDKSLKMRIYNKQKESQRSGKEYQLFNNNNEVWRTEVSISAKQLHKNKKYSPTEYLTLIEDVRHLKELFTLFSSKLFRYRKGKIKVRGIIF